MSKFLEVKRGLVLTEHSKDNLRGRRTDGKDRTGIKVRDIIKTLAYGQYGFAGGGKRHKKSLNNIEVVYKINDSKGYKEYVVITYYRIKPTRYTNIVDRKLKKYHHYC